MQFNLLLGDRLLLLDWMQHRIIYCLVRWRVLSYRRRRRSCLEAVSCLVTTGTVVGLVQPTYDQYEVRRYL
jgi:hypothetical protein